MVKKLQFCLAIGIILVLGVLLPGASEGSSVNEADMPPLEKSKPKMVNLEVTHLFHALKWVKWKEEDLPHAGKPMKCLIVGEDPFRFKERLSFIFAESGNGLAGHPIEFLSFGKMSEALTFSKTAPDVMILVALDSTADEWIPSQYPKRRGFVVYGQSDTFRKQGMTFCSCLKRNRVKLSVNMRRANSAGVSLSKELLKQKSFFYIENGNASGPEEN
jgi:hypothetical protein